MDLYKEMILPQDITNVVISVIYIILLAAMDMDVNTRME